MPETLAQMCQYVTSFCDAAPEKPLVAFSRQIFHSSRKVILSSFAAGHDERLKWLTTTPPGY